MKKHTSEEAHYERMRNLANVNKKSIKENHALGTLIDYKRASNGIAYGIIKENHKYFLKKGSIKQDPNVADFAYIGGLGNITNFQYKSLAEADKHRNMVLNTINETTSKKINKNGSKKVLNEDKAGDEINMASEKIDDLDAATIADDTTEEPAPMGGTGIPAISEPTGGVESPMGDTNSPIKEPTPEDSEEASTDDTVTPENGEETSTEEPATDGTEATVEDNKDITTKEIEKNLGKLTEKIRKTEMTDSQVKSYVNTFLSAFKDKFPNVEIEDRKAMAEKITKVVPDEDIEDLGSSISPDEQSVEEGQCSECGGFAQYAESRGYNADSIQECGDEEMSNLVSGYANAHNDGQNDGDLKIVALFASPSVMEKLKNDYGHDEYAEKLTPYNNISDEEKSAQLNELFGGLGFLGKKAGQAISNKANQIKQTYYAGEKNAALSKLEAMATELGKQIATVNIKATKAGEKPININSILTTIKNQVGNSGTANLSSFRTTENTDPANVETQPPLNEEDEKIDDTEEITQEPETIDNKPEIGFAPDGQSLGAGVVKPDGAETIGVDVNVDAQNKTVSVTMNESELKVRKYVRNYLEEKMNKKKPVLNEDKKSEKLKKLDSMINEQLKLYESIALKKKEHLNEIFGLSVAEKFAKLDPNDAANVEALFRVAFKNILTNPQMGIIGKIAKITPTNIKYQLLKQYVDGNGGTLRLAPNNKTVIYAPESVKNAAIKSKFSGGGTGGGNFGFGGV